MILVQKSPIFNLTQSPSYSHRRHPSAPPAVLVQPTRIPGLLSLSKPIRSTPQRLLPSHQRNNSVKPPVKQKQQQVVRAPVLLNPAEITEKKGPTAVHTPASPSPQTRGRVAAKHGRDKISPQRTRSVSQSLVRGKHGRQPSPPVQPQIQTSSQAEALTIPSTNNLFDPFMDSTDMQDSTPLPTNLSKPSGKLASRRKQSPSTPSPAIPVPISAHPSPAQFSRSDPAPSHMRPRPVPKRSSTVASSPVNDQWQYVCDDSKDMGDSSENNSPLVLTPPSTPVRKQPYVDNGPRTAPISARSPGTFPFNTGVPFPSPMSQKKTRNHRRVPSEGVFNMSSDEDLSTGPDSVVLNASVQALFGLVGSTRVRPSASAKPPSTPSPSLSRATAAAIYRDLNSSPSKDKETAERAAAYYASSMFQNSPSPEELPDPLLF